MQPVSPVVPGFNFPEIKIAEGQVEFMTLPAVVVNDGATLLTRWQLTDEDRKRIADGQDLFVWITTHGQPVQPINLEACTVTELMTPREGQQLESADKLM